jgi:hypothetical protein
MLPGQVLAYGCWQLDAGFSLVPDPVQPARLFSD